MMTNKHRNLTGKTRNPSRLYLKSITRLGTGEFSYFIKALSERWDDAVYTTVSFLSLFDPCHCKLIIFSIRSTIM